MTEPLSLAGRIASVRCALHGVWHVLKSQHNAWIHAAATLAVLGLGLGLGLGALEWALMLMAIASVWAAEAFNTAVELLADVVSPDVHPVIGKAKDVAAGAVLITVLGAVAVGVFVLGPHVQLALGA